MTIKASIQIPSPENLPFIDRNFSENFREAFEDDEDMFISEWPGIMGHDLLEAYRALDLTRVVAIFDILKPSAAGQPVRSHRDLQVAAASGEQAFMEKFGDEDLDDFTPEMLEMYHLHSAILAKHIDWRKVAEAYNDAPDGQKAALDTFFWGFYRASLSDLMTKGARSASMPAGLAANETLVIDGAVHVICPIARQPVPEAEFHRQFEVHVNEGIAGLVEVLGYAGTLEKAIAIATAYTLGKNGPVINPNTGEPKALSPQVVSGQMSKFTIKLHTKEVAKGDTIHSVAKSSGQAAQTCRIEWEYRKSDLVTESAFRKTLWATEKLFDVSWGKTHHLQQDLGI